MEWGPSAARKLTAVDADPGDVDHPARRGETGSTAGAGDGSIRRVVPLRIVRGDATSPQAKGPKIVAHVCNDLGGWGKGFVLAISRRWPEPESAYRRWHRERAGNDFGLGATQLVQVRPDTWVANMVAQRGIRTGSGGPPIRYDAVERCLRAVAEHALRLSASVHMPRIGCGLAGGRWERIEPLVVAALSERGIATTVYDHD
ncbi:macro domain-containing protein [Micromonospora sp. NPDC049559]|uniref:macro domain-containing protein n=1 Tax=Micromonospora sp. NPDC049559 TaxID=3155923 RepID=UPI00344513F1